MADARVTYPRGRVMADGRVRVPALFSRRVTVSGTDYIEWDPDADWEWETIPDPEPKWEPGDAARDMAGNVFVRTEAGRWREALGRLDVDPARPLTRLVPQ